MRLCALDLHHKSAYLCHCLRQAGFEFVSVEYKPNGQSIIDFEMLLVDSDHPLSPPIPQKHNLLRAAAKKGVPIVVYPHGGPPDLDLDGLRSRANVIAGWNHACKDLGQLAKALVHPPDWTYGPVTLQLAHGEGHVEINRRFGSGRRVEAVGWMYGPVFQRNPSPPGGSGPYIESIESALPQPETRYPQSHKEGARPVAESARSGSGEPGESPTSILFAPIHPWADGKGILEPHKRMNQRAYKQFLEHPASRKVVRMFGEDAPNGVYERVDGVEYTQTDLTVTSAFNVVQEFDAVISYGTFAYTAISLGVPTAMIYGYPPHASDDGETQAVHFEEYADYCRYPASVGDAPLDELFRMDVSEWRRLFVGDQLDVDRLSGLLTSLRPSRAVRRALARA